jgi:hypothetical protein
LSFQIRKGYDQTTSRNVPKGTMVTLLSLIVPGNSLFMISHFANFVGDIGAWTNVKWSVRINGIPDDQTLGSVLDQLGDPSNPRQLGRQIIAQPGDLVEVTATNLTDIAAGTDYGAGVSLKGGYGRAY